MGFCRESAAWNRHAGWGGSLTLTGHSWGDSLTLTGLHLFKNINIVSSTSLDFTSKPGALADTEPWYFSDLDEKEQGGRVEMHKNTCYLMSFKLKKFTIPFSK